VASFSWLPSYLHVFYLCELEPGSLDDGLDAVRREGAPPAWANASDDTPGRSPGDSVIEHGEAPVIAGTCDGGERYCHRMDRGWAIDQLRAFIEDIDKVSEDKFWEDRAVARHAVEGLISVDPVMRDLMNAARPGLGNYASPQATENIVNVGETTIGYFDKRYWSMYPRNNALKRLVSSLLALRPGRECGPTVQTS
jgi:hypothetical protein